MEVRGRSCPIGYRYRPEALVQPARLEADTLYVVGGLYGNLFARGPCSSGQTGTSQSCVLG